VLPFIGEMMVFDLVVDDRRRAACGRASRYRRTSTNVRSNGTPSISVSVGDRCALFAIILAFVAMMTRWLRRRDKLEF
jgi:hypothetical protein